MQEQITKVLFEYVAPYVAMLGVLMLLYLMQLAISVAKQKVTGIKDDDSRKLLDMVISLAGQKVLAAEQTMVSEIKKQVESGGVDKMILPKLMAEVKKTTVQRTQRDAGALGVWKRVAGQFESERAALDWLEDVIESHVAQLPPAGLDSMVRLPAHLVEEITRGPTSDPKPEQAGPSSTPG